MKANCFVIDDEPLAIQVIESYIEKVPWLRLAGSYSDPIEALEAIGKKKVDALAENIQRINPITQVTSICLRLTTGHMHEPFHQADIIIEALDEATIKKQFLEEILEKLPSIPLIAASGTAGFGHSDRIVTRHLDNLYLCYDEEAASSDDDVLLAPKVGIMAHWQANIAIALLLGGQT